MCADFKRVCLIGKTQAVGDLWVRVSFSAGKLGIVGVEGPTNSGNSLGSCGQINDHDWKIVEYNTGWGSEKVRKLREIWTEWHLNDMQAGSPKQMAVLKAHGHVGYTAACEILKESGCYTDNGYAYGSKWLRVEVPEDVVQFLRDLPITVGCPWRNL